jgi:transposase InsO family protein
MKNLTMRAKMRALGVESSRGRLGVSNDSPYCESLFRTLKYSPRWPSEGVEPLEKAWDSVKDFTHWHNKKQCYSNTKFITPEKKHLGLDKETLKKRHELYLAQKQKSHIGGNKKQEIEREKKQWN